MTNQVKVQQQEPTQNERKRGPKSFPTLTFEDAMILVKGIREHGVGGRIRRLMLFDKLGRRPDSSTSRQLVTTSSRYGLTSGGYQAEYLSITDDGEALFADKLSERERHQKMFQLAIEQFDVFSKLNERLVGKRLPASDVLRDEIGQIGVAQADQDPAVKIFMANARYLKLVREVSGSERIVSIEQALEELPATTKSPAVREGVAAKVVTDGQSQPGPSAPPTPFTTLPDPSVHIDIQIHIDSSASSEQIDQVFASMARHLYRREA